MTTGFLEAPIDAKPWRDLTDSELERYDLTTFGGRLAALRKGRGLTQSDLAHLVEVSQDAVARWEQNRNTPPSFRKANLSQVLKLLPGILDRDDLAKGTFNQIVRKFSIHYADNRDKMISASGKITPPPMPTAEHFKAWMKEAESIGIQCAYAVDDRAWIDSEDSSFSEKHIHGLEGIRLDRYGDPVVALQIGDEHMAPTVPMGAVVIVNLRWTLPSEPGEIYLVKTERGFAQVVRVQFRSDDESGIDIMYATWDHFDHQGKERVLREDQIIGRVVEIRRFL